MKENTISLLKVTIQSQRVKSKYLDQHSRSIPRAVHHPQTLERKATSIVNAYTTSTHAN